MGAELDQAGSPLRGESTLWQEALACGQQKGVLSVPMRVGSEQQATGPLRWSKPDSTSEPLVAGARG